MGRMFLQKNTLSEKEKEILQLLTWGRTNKEIASSLRVSPETVKMTLKNIFRKLGVENRTQAAVLAIKEQLNVRAQEIGRPCHETLCSNPLSPRRRDLF